MFISCDRNKHRLVRWIAFFWLLTWSMSDWGFVQPEQALSKEQIIIEQIIKEQIRSLDTPEGREALAKALLEAAQKNPLPTN